MATLNSISTNTRMSQPNLVSPQTGTSLVRREYRYSNDADRRSGRLGKNMAKRTTKVALNTTGATMQVGGNAVKKAGGATMRAGAAMSSTGAGAVVGVPLMAVGGSMYGAGSATRVAGTVVRKSSRLIKVSDDDKKPTKLGRYTVKILKWISITVLLFWQIVLVGLFLGLLAMQTWSENASINGAWDKLWDGNFSGALEEAGQSLVSSLIGLEAGVGLAVGIWGFCLAISWFFLFLSLGIILMQKWCRVSNIEPLNTSRKELLFIIALVFYAMPVVQAGPWAWFWLRHLGKHGADTE